MEMVCWVQFRPLSALNGTSSPLLLVSDRAAAESPHCKAPGPGGVSVLLLKCLRRQVDHPGGDTHLDVRAAAAWRRAHPAAPPRVVQ